MPKVTLTDLEAGYGLKTSYNANNDAIQAGFENTLSRDGSTPNAMAAELDMNSNKIINVKNGTAAKDAVNVSQLEGTVFSNLDVGSATVVHTYAALSAIASPTDGDVAIVDGEGISGIFVYDSALAATDNGGTIIDGWSRRHDGNILSTWFEPSKDGITDDTLVLQAGLDVAKAGGFNYTFVQGRYKVSKNTALSGFPDNDQPCLALINATGMKIFGYGATLKVNEHAQGILELQGCTDCLIEGLEFEGEGSANFPQLDGTTGQGEKGTVGGNGYGTSGFWGHNKNNSSDTSADNRGGFGGLFPQWGGGTAATWGVWNGGYIGNVGIGLLIHEASKRITVTKCKAHGFNYSGLQVGFRGAADVGTESEDIRFIDNECHDNYARGITTMDVDGVLVQGNTLTNMGHPDAAPITDTLADPGYGYSATGIPTYYTRNGVVANNIVEDCVRKGIDSHAHDGLIIEGNTIRNCGATAISVPWTDATQPCINTVIRGNFIRNCSYATNNLGTILGGGAIDGGYSYANSLCNLIIDGNIIEDCGGNGIEIKNGRNIQITNNILRGFDDRAIHGAKYFMFIGRASTNEPIYNLNCSNNVCDADGDTDRYRGISVRYAHNSQVNHNMVYMDHASVSQGVDLHQCTTTQAFGNVVYHDPANLTSVPLALLQTDGQTIGNYSDPDAGALSYPMGHETTAGEKEKPFRVPNIIQLDITFNGTASPSYVVNAGEDYIDSVQELATYGCSITFKNMHSTVMLRSFLTQKSAAGITIGGSPPYVGYVYERALSNSGMEIGLKVTQDGANVIASNALTGTLSVTLLAF